MIAMEKGKPLSIARGLLPNVRGDCSDVDSVEFGHQKRADEQSAEAGCHEENDIQPRKFSWSCFTEVRNSRVETTIHETLTPGLCGLERLQVLAGLEADGLSGRNVDFGTGARISTDAGLARFYRKDAKASQLNAIVGLQSVLHAVEDGIDRLFGFGLADARALDDLIDKIQFDHRQTS